MQKSILHSGGVGDVLFLQRSCVFLELDRQFSDQTPPERGILVSLGFSLKDLNPSVQLALKATKLKHIPF